MLALLRLPDFWSVPGYARFLPPEAGTGAWWRPLLRRLFLSRSLRMDASRFSPGQLILNVRFQVIKRFVLDWLIGNFSLAELLSLSSAREVLVCDSQRIP